MLHSCRRIPLSTKRRRTSSLWWVVSLPSPLRLFSRWLVCECLLPQCRQVTAACDDILTSSPEALLTHTAQLESVDLVPVSPGDKLVKPTILSLCVWCNLDLQGIMVFFLVGTRNLTFPLHLLKSCWFFLSFPWIVTGVILPIPSYFLTPLSFSAWSAPSLPGSSPCRFVPLTSSSIWFKVLHIRSFSLLSPRSPLCLFFVNAFSSLFFRRCIQSSNYVSPLRVHHHCVLFIWILWKRLRPQLPSLSLLVIS